MAEKDVQPGVEGPNRKARRAARKEGRLDTAAFLKVADTFIDGANRENRSVVASDLHMAFLYAAARYNAFVGRGVLEIESDEAFAAEMAGHYADMLRQHLANPGLVPGETAGGDKTTGEDG